MGKSRILGLAVVAMGVGLGCDPGESYTVEEAPSQTAPVSGAPIASPAHDQTGENPSQSDFTETGVDADGGVTDAGRSEADGATTPTQPTGGVWQPTPAAPIHFHWQLSDNFDAARDARPGVTVYDLDGENTSAATVAALHALGPNVKVVCYFDTAYESYRADKAKFPAAIIGKEMVDWPGIYWIDIRRLDVVIPILKERMVNWCKNKGFDAIEADDTEVYSNDSGFPLTKADNTAFNKAIADEAHALGLSAGLKNNNGDAADYEPYFDWALTEECWQYAECDNFQKSFLAKGKAVFNVEYAKTPNCAQANAWHMNSIKRDIDLVGPLSKQYVYQPCVPDGQSTW